MDDSQDNRDLAESSNLLFKDRSDLVGKLKLAEAETRRLATSHYENFVVASILLPRRLRQPFYNVYAFCRTADDLADQSPSPALAREHLDHFQCRLDAVFRGYPPEGLFLALAETIEQFSLEKQPFDDLLWAFRQDQAQNRYRTFAELLEYCQKSANPVGRILLRMVGADSESNLQYSDEICTGLQLANFLQDVRRDGEIDRIYLPREDWGEFGVDESMILAGESNSKLRRLIAHHCDRAEAYLRRGLPLAQNVPKWFSKDVLLFAHGGLETLKAIRRIDHDVWRVRPTVGKWKQMSLVTRAFLGML